MAANRKSPGIGKAVAELWLTVTSQLFDSYHPERHYMRGPGPKWHAKHAGPSDMPLGAMPAMVRIKAR
jgi:hypothetical protein